MKRTNIYLADAQVDVLRRVSESRGRPVASLVREAVDSWLSAQGIRRIPENEWRSRFAALLAHRDRVAKGQGIPYSEVVRDVNDAVRQVRRRRAARRR